MLHVNRLYFRYIKIDTWLGDLGNKTKEIILKLNNKSYISFVLFLQASELGINFNISKIVYSPYTLNYYLAQS